MSGGGIKTTRNLTDADIAVFRKFDILPDSGFFALAQAIHNYLSTVTKIYPLFVTYVQCHRRFTLMNSNLLLRHQRERNIFIACYSHTRFLSIVADPVGTGY